MKENTRGLPRGPAGSVMYIVIDCETTGLPKNWKAPISELDNWPRIVQVAWALYDKESHPVDSRALLIQPDGFTIPLEAQRVHHISTERAKAEGKPLGTALQEFADAVGESEVVVAHNLRFDESVISAEYLRLKLTPPFLDKKRICTMVGTTELCRIPGQYGYKWPSLSELHRFLFGTGFEEAHDAGADVAACADCFLELKRRRVFI
jgi:DNA polymerase-3 subunit epsilon